jgi:hypothetical protein
MSTNEGKGFDKVDQLLKETGFQLLGEDKADEFHRQMVEQLEVIGKAGTEIDAGGGKVVLPSGNHLRLGGTVWPLLTCTVTFVLAPLDPSGLTYAAAGGAVVNAFKELAKVFHALDPAQRVVCRAVLEVARDKKIKGGAPEASIAELQAYFKGRNEVVPVKLNDLLAALAKLEVLREINYPSTGSFYRVKF